MLLDHAPTRSQPTSATGRSSPRWGGGLSKDRLVWPAAVQDGAARSRGGGYLHLMQNHPGCTVYPSLHKDLFMTEILIVVVVVLALFLKLKEVSALRDMNKNLQNANYLLADLVDLSKHTHDEVRDQLRALANTLESTQLAADDIRDIANIYYRYRLPSLTERAELDEQAITAEVLDGISRQKRNLALNP